VSYYHQGGHLGVTRSRTTAKKHAIVMPLLKSELDRDGRVTCVVKLSNGSGGPFYQQRVLTDKWKYAKKRYAECFCSPVCSMIPRIT